MERFLHKVRHLAKLVIPPVFLRFYRVIAGKNVYRGNFANWAQAMRRSDGYSAEVILDKVKLAALKVRDGEAAFERDSILFETPVHSHAVLAWLQRIALANDCRLNVLDFGGALGSSYYQWRDFLSGLKTLEWSVVEQKSFVDSGKKHFENGQLKFFYSIDECLGKKNVDVVLLSGVVQYLEDPHAFLEDLLGKRIKYLIFDRTPLVTGRSRDILAVQRVPKQIYDASYPVWIFDSKKFVSHFEAKYDLLEEFES